MERRSSMWICALVLASTACGSSGSGGSSGGSTGGDPAAPFVGVWVVQSGTAVQRCGGAPPFADGGPDRTNTNANKTTSVTYSKDEFALTFAETSPGQLAQVTDASTCRWTWSVSGSTATMDGDNPCTGDIAAGGDGGYFETIVTNSADTATISGSTMTETLGGTDTITVDGQTVTCQLSGSTTLAACLPAGGTCMSNVECCSGICNISAGTGSC